MQKTSLLIAAFLLLSLAACFNDRDDYKFVPETVEGYRPVYFDTSQDIRSLIYSTAPKGVQKPGKIYIYKQYLFVGEPGKGVHVFDNRDPASPLPFAFINIPYNYDIAIRDTVMFADTYAGLVTIGIGQLPKIYVLQYIKGSSLTPPLPQGLATGNNWGGRGFGSRIYFECPEPDRGMIVGWEQVKLSNPKCYQ